MLYTASAGNSLSLICMSSNSCVCLNPHLLVKQRSRLRRGDRLRRLRRRHQVRAVLDREAEQKGQLTHGAIPCSPHQRVLHVLDGEGRSGFRRAKYGVERFQPEDDEYKEITKHVSVAFCRFQLQATYRGLVAKYQ